MLDRMMRAARLDASLYEEVEADTTLTSQAATVVVIVAICQGIGTAIGVIRNPDAGGSGAAIGALVAGIIGALIGWVIWSYVTYFIGTSIFKGTATPGEMLRTIGFAQTPGALNILSFIPILGGIIGLVVAIWVLIAGVVAVRQALDFDTVKAIMTTIVGWFFLVIVGDAVAAVFGVGALLTGAIR